MEEEEEEELIETYDAVGKYFSSRGNSEKAVAAKKRSFEIAQKSKKPVAAEKSLELASSYLSNSQPSEAREQLNYTIELADSLQDLKTKVEAYKSVIALSDSISKDSLLLYYKNLLAFQDSLNNKKIKQASWHRQISLHCCDRCSGCCNRISGKHVAVDIQIIHCCSCGHDARICSDDIAIMLSFRK